MLKAYLCTNANPIGVKPVNAFLLNAHARGHISMPSSSRVNHFVVCHHDHEHLMTSPYELLARFGLNALATNTNERCGVTSIAEEEFHPLSMKCYGIQEWT